MFSQSGLLLAIAVVAFVFGWVGAKIAGPRNGRDPAVEAPSEHRHIRSLQASLRVAQKKADDMTEQFDSTCADFNSLKEAHEELEAVFAEREARLVEAEEALRDETTKVRELRRELTERVEATIRAEAHAKEMETELSVMEAGSRAMRDQVSRPAAGRDGPPDKMRAVKPGVAHRPQAPADDDSVSTEEFLRDC
jgi:septal ring factor EnvC (AmiA/AmiB activator)